MVKFQQSEARIFAAHVLEDALHFAENNQKEFIAFITSTCGNKHKLADKQNDEFSYKNQSAI
jgi:hypothetical protein